MWPLLFTFFFLFHFPAALLALPAQPETAPLQPLVFPTSTPPSTIPAFPEQSDVAGTCPLNLPQELFRGVSRACPSSTAPPSRSRCCPTLAAWLYAAYSATALAAAARLPPPSTSSSSRPPSDMPLLPDDSETCVDGVEKALRSRGLALAAVNDTCDVAYCYCGVRLRPFTCPGGLALDRDAAGQWVASGDAARRIERDCALPGAAGCSRCLRSLYQVSRHCIHRNVAFSKIPVAAVATARAYMYTPKKTCHGSRKALLFLEPPGYQKVANPSNIREANAFGLFLHKSKLCLPRTEYHRLTLLARSSSTSARPCTIDVGLGIFSSAPVGISSSPHIRRCPTAPTVTFPAHHRQHLSATVAHCWRSCGPLPRATAVPSSITAATSASPTCSIDPGSKNSTVGSSIGIGLCCSNIGKIGDFPSPCSPSCVRYRCPLDPPHP
ncbi:hypothetical protein Taro_003136 [Colocasia esculenta]|uniref:SPARK domain-containing protein n=1 Tax=Colocasia esculenta TaxID=4460 RepID=A0A843TEJ5_COLES|nr:hypothetical protein [Colocasia esculenta]